MNKPMSLRTRSPSRLPVFLLVVLLAACVRNGLAQEHKVRVNALIQETQKMSEEPSELTLVWWIPEEFWQINFARDATVTEAQAQEFLKVLRPYTLVAVVDGTIGPFGGVAYRSEAELRASIQISDSQGTGHSPLADDEIDANTKNLLSMMKPVLVNLLGPTGQNMHFFLFPAEDQEGKRIAEAKKGGTLSVKLGEREFRWRLPLGSLLPPRMCPRCKEECSGAWSFCPWCGTRLSR